VTTAGIIPELEYGWQMCVIGDVDSTAVTMRTRKGRLAQINTSRRAAYGYDQRCPGQANQGRA
jgi:hypothetical protein